MRAGTGLARALTVLRTELAECRRCTPAVAGVRPVLSLARAPRVMLVGQAPGRTEVSARRPFAGRAGRTLFRWLEQAGMDEPAARKEIYISAVTRCYPGPHQGGRGDRVPSREEQQACSEWLKSELTLIRPRLLIPVGRLAIDRFLPPAPLHTLIGREHMVTHPGGTSVAIPLPHPSGASSWTHQAGNRALVDTALCLLEERFIELGLTGAAR